MGKEKISYQKAMEELEAIQEALENHDISIDELSDKVKRAYDLIKICQTKLKNNSQQIDSLLNEDK